MSNAVTVAAYRPGDTLVHRLPVGAKLAALALFSLTVVLVRSMPASWVWLGLALLAALVARTDLATLLRAARMILVLAVVVSAFQWWIDGPAKAVETLVDLLALALGAIVVSATTSVNAMLDAIVTVGRPPAPGRHRPRPGRADLLDGDRRPAGHGGAWRWRPATPRGRAGWAGTPAPT